MTSFDFTYCYVAGAGDRQPIKLNSSKLPFTIKHVQMASRFLYAFEEQIFHPTWLYIFHSIGERIAIKQIKSSTRKICPKKERKKKLLLFLPRISLYVLPSCAVLHIESPLTPRSAPIPSSRRQKIIKIETGF